jgi:hypothetical protein
MDVMGVNHLIEKHSPKGKYDKLLNFGGKLCYACKTRQSVTFTFSNRSRIPHIGGGLHVDKVTWDESSRIMSSNGGGTSFTSKFLVASTPKVICVGKSNQHGNTII